MVFYNYILSSFVGSSIGLIIFSTTKSKYDLETRMKKLENKFEISDC